MRLATSYTDFWPVYLREHSKPRTRHLHFVGTAGGFCLLACDRTPAALLKALAFGYVWAWVGHFFVEHNKPATFYHPLWSLASDFRMFFLWLTNRLDPELRRYLD